MKNRFAVFTGAKELINLPEEKKLSEVLKPSEKQESGEQEVRRRGRPSGKRSDEGFKQVTAYINLDTYKKTKIRLFEEDSKQEFSELVDMLLQRWLKEK
jgi:hypothetical protein